MNMQFSKMDFIESILNAGYTPAQEDMDTLRGLEDTHEPGRLIAFKAFQNNLGIKVYPSFVYLTPNIIKDPYLEFYKVTPNGDELLNGVWLSNEKGFGFITDPTFDGKTYKFLWRIVFFMVYRDFIKKHFNENSKPPISKLMGYFTEVKNYCFEEYNSEIGLGKNHYLYKSIKDPIFNLNDETMEYSWFASRLFDRFNEVERFKNKETSIFNGNFTGFKNYRTKPDDVEELDMMNPVFDTVFQFEVSHDISYPTESNISKITRKVKVTIKGLQPDNMHFAFKSKTLEELDEIIKIEVNDEIITKEN